MEIEGQKDRIGGQNLKRANLICYNVPVSKMETGGIRHCRVRGRCMCRVGKGKA